MTNKDWIIISLIGAGILLLAKKAVSMDETDVIERLKNASLPINLTADELRVMQYAGIMMYEAQRQGIAPEIIAGIIRQESSGIAQTKTYEPKVNDYSYGLMQMLPLTAADLKLKNPSLKYDGNPLSLFIPDVSIEIGTAYLAQQLNRYTANPKLNPITDMIAAYNAGTAFVSNGQYTNQSYVDHVIVYKTRFRLMFNYLYQDYGNLFPLTRWGN